MMNTKAIFRILLFSILAGGATTLGLSAHSGHAEAPGEGGEAPSAGPIVITPEAKRNLGLITESADIRRIENTLTVIGQITAIPNRLAAVSSRISGRVTDLSATEGMSVKKGQNLIEVESRQPGDPPPRVYYASPIDGVIIDRHVVLGDTVEPDRHLFEIADLSEVYAEGSIFEGQIADVRLGQTARVRVESYPDEAFTGKVDRFGGVLDPESRTLKVWVKITNSDGRLRSGMRAQLSIVTAETAFAVSVPRSAILGEAGNLFVFVQSDTDDLVFEKRAVVTGMSDDRYVEIVEGAYPGEAVVTVGNYQLQYVTTTAAGKEDSADETSTLPAYKDGPAQEHSRPEEATYSPMLLMGVAVAALLLVNAGLLLLKRKPRVPAGTDSGKTVST